MQAVKRKNIDEQVVEDFGREWSAYDQSGMTDATLIKAFEQYFSIFPFKKLPKNAEGFDMGCGSGRWANIIASKVGTLHCIEPSERALAVAKEKLARHKNCHFYQASVGDPVLEAGSQDFGYSLGVLHHIPDTQQGIKDCHTLLKPGAPFLLYLYYDFENRPGWFKALWRASDVIRRGICMLPFSIKKPVTAVIAAIIYYPLARLALAAEKAGMDVANFPLTDYRDKPFYYMRTDALDRFGTRLEKRFSKADIRAMLETAGFANIKFSDGLPHWVCVSYKK